VYQAAAAAAPLRIASSSVSAQCTNVKNPTWSLTNAPTGSGHRPAAARYSSTRRPARSNDSHMVVPSTPTPRRPASSNDAGLAAACQSGGWGRCTGFGEIGTSSMR
jgi:hypothetical protein